MPYNFGHNAAVRMKKISCTKREDTVNYSIVTRCFKKFCSGCKNLDNQAKSDRSITVDSKTVLRDIEANLVSRTGKVSGELSISLFRVVNQLHDFNKGYEAVELYLTKIF